MICVTHFDKVVAVMEKLGSSGKSSSSTLKHLATASQILDACRDSCSSMRLRADQIDVQRISRAARCHRHSSFLSSYTQYTSHTLSTSSIIIFIPTSMSLHLSNFIANSRPFLFARIMPEHGDLIPYLQHALPSAALIECPYSFECHPR